MSHTSQKSSNPLGLHYPDEQSGLYTKGASTAGLAEASRRPRREAPETAEACRGARPLINCRGANFGICSVGTGSSRTVRLPFNFLSITFLSRDEEIDDANSEQPLSD